LSPNKAHYSLERTEVGDSIFTTRKLHFEGAGLRLQSGIKITLSFAALIVPPISLFILHPSPMV
jgi:hypothetical protein